MPRQKSSGQLSTLTNCPITKIFVRIVSVISTKSRANVARANITRMNDARTNFVRTPQLSPVNDVPHSRSHFVNQFFSLSLCVFLFFKIPIRSLLDQEGRRNFAWKLYVTPKN